MSSSDCRRLQQEELEVLESIYPECLSSEVTEGTLKLEIPIEFGIPRTVVVIRGVVLPETMSEVISVSTLPPLLVHVHLPETYPLTMPPTIVSIRATHLWLPQGGLNELLVCMWNPGDGALYTWVEYLRSGEFLEGLGLIRDGDNAIQVSHPNPSALMPLLTSYDVSSRSSQFSQNAHPCSICLSTLKGSKCLRLSCEHIFCRACLHDFWSTCITEGDIDRVGCPDPKCVKDNREADEEEVTRAVTGEQVTRWRWLREKRVLNRDAAVVQCPVDSCQALVTSLEGDSIKWEKFRECPKCKFCFCVSCRRIWHGPVTSCTKAPVGIEDPDQVLFEYLKAGLEARAEMEEKYGRTVVRGMAQRYRDEQASEAWLAESTKKCPWCSAHVQKEYGCNHMTCFQCGKDFCYICGDPLPDTDKSSHYGQRKGGCFMFGQ